MSAMVGEEAALVVAADAAKAAPPAASFPSAMDVDDDAGAPLDAQQQEEQPASATEARRVSPVGERMFLGEPFGISTAEVDEPLERSIAPDMPAVELQRKAPPAMNNNNKEQKQQMPEAPSFSNNNSGKNGNIKKRRVVRSQAKRYFPHQATAATARATKTTAAAAATHDPSNATLQYRTDGTILVVRDGDKNNSDDPASTNPKLAAYGVVGGPSSHGNSKKAKRRASTGMKTSSHRTAERRLSGFPSSSHDQPQQQQRARGGFDVFQMINANAAKLPGGSQHSSSTSGSGESSSSNTSSSSGSGSSSSGGSSSSNHRAASPFSSGDESDYDERIPAAAAARKDPYHSRSDEDDEDDDYKPPPPSGASSFYPSQVGTSSNKIGAAIRDVFGGDERAFVLDVKKYCVDGDMMPAEYSRTRLLQGMSCRKTVMIISQYWQGVKPTTPIERWKALIRKLQLDPNYQPPGKKRAVNAAAASRGATVAAASSSTQTKIDQAIEAIFEGDERAFINDVKKMCVDGKMSPTHYSRSRLLQGDSCTKTVLIVTQYWQGRKPSTAVSRWKNLIAAEQAGLGAEAAQGLTKIDQAIRDTFDGDEHAFVMDVKKYCVDGDMEPVEYSQVRLNQGYSCRKTVLICQQYWRGIRPTMEIGRWKQLVQSAAAKTKKQEEKKKKASGPPMLPINSVLHVYWPLDGKYFAATVRGRNDDANLHFIEYQDDGVTEWIDLRQQTFKLDDEMTDKDKDKSSTWTTKTSGKKRPAAAVSSPSLTWDGRGTSNKKSKKQRVVIEHPSPTDVVLGRGSDIYALPGNQQFHVFCKQAHKNATRGMENKEIAQQVVRAVESQNPPGRFLEKLGDGAFVVAGDERAHQKCYFAICKLKNTGDSRSSGPAYVFANEKKAASKATSTKPKAVKKHMVGTIIKRLSSTDVVFGKGKNISALPGNRLFRDLCREAYDEASDDMDFRDIARQAVRAVREQNPPGRFVEQNDDGETYTTVEDDSRAVTKAYTLIRKISYNENLYATAEDEDDEEGEEATMGYSSLAATTTKPRKKSSGVIKRLTSTDVLFGLGKGISELDGNVRFRELCREAYKQSSSRDDLKEVAREAVHAVWEQDPPGRFLESNDGYETYTTVEDERAVHKAYTVVRKLRYNESVAAGGDHDKPKASTTSYKKTATLQHSLIGERKPASFKKSSGLKHVSKTDVLFGQGPTFYQHEGNIRFRDLCREIYLKAPPGAEKTELARAVVRAVRDQNPPGRFLEKHSETKMFEPVDEEKAIQKAFAVMTRPGFPPPPSPGYKHNPKKETFTFRARPESKQPRKKSDAGIKRSPSEMTSAIKHLSDTDVLFGTGRGVQDLKGNVRFRELCREVYDESASHHDLKAIAPEVVRAVKEQDPPGRFLENHGETYKTVEDARCVKKAYGVLRKIKYTESISAGLPDHDSDDAPSDEPEAAETTAEEEEEDIEEEDVDDDDDDDEEDVDEDEDPDEEEYQPTKLKVGARIAVYHTDADQYFQAIVRARNMNLHKLEYTVDGKVEWLDLDESSFTVMS